VLKHIGSENFLEMVRRQHRQMRGVGDQIGLVHGLQVDVEPAGPHVVAAADVDAGRQRIG